MTVTEITETQLNQEISQIQSKIATLESYLTGLRSQQELDTPISGDASPEEIIQKAQKLAQQQQQAISINAEESVVERTLGLLHQELAQKQEALQILRRSSEFGRMQTLAHEFNGCIDKAFSVLEEMKKIHEEIRTQTYTPLRISADLNEAPFCNIHDTIVRVRRRLDAKRDS